jgi:hypothetical protein
MTGFDAIAGDSNVEIDVKACVKGNPDGSGEGHRRTMPFEDWQPDDLLFEQETHGFASPPRDGFAFFS